MMQAVSPPPAASNRKSPGFSRWITRYSALEAAHRETSVYNRVQQKPSGRGCAAVLVRAGRAGAAAQAWSSPNPNSGDNVQQAKHSRPPGRAANAAAGSAKNMTRRSEIRIEMTGFEVMGLRVGLDREILRMPLSAIRLCAAADVGIRRCRRRPHDPCRRLPRPRHGKGAGAAADFEHLLAVRGGRVPQQKNRSRAHPALDETFEPDPARTSDSVPIFALRGVHGDILGHPQTSSVLWRPGYTAPAVPSCQFGNGRAHRRSRRLKERGADIAARPLPLWAEGALILTRSEFAAKRREPAMRSTSTDPTADGGVAVDHVASARAGSDTRPGGRRDRSPGRTAR